MWIKCASTFQESSTEMAKLFCVYIFSWANPCRERSEQIHEYSQVHYVQFENVSLFCICEFLFAPKASDISWQCIVKFSSRWKISKCIFYQIKGKYIHVQYWCMQSAFHTSKNSAPVKMFTISWCPVRALELHYFFQKTTTCIGCVELSNRVTEECGNNTCHFQHNTSISLEWLCKPQEDVQSW